MDRVAAGGDASSKVAVADASATDGPWTKRDKETLYRRPPARPGATDESGSAWFAAEGTDGESDRRVLDERRVTTTGEQGAIQIPAEPELGPATPGGSVRASFGFSAGPISPVRQTSAPPAPSVPEPELPTRKRKSGESRKRRQAEADLAVRTPGDPVAGSRPPAVPTDLPVAGSAPGLSTGSRPAVGATDWPSPESGAGRPSPESGATWPAPDGGANWPVPEGGATWPAPEGGAHRSVPDGGAGWPPPERIDRADLDRVSGEIPVPSGDHPGWAGNGTEEGRVAHREPPADPYPAKQSRVFTLGIVALSMIVLVAGAIVGAVYFSGSDGKLDSVLELGAGDSGQRIVTAPLDNRTSASFELLAGTNQVRLSIGELGDDLYRISTPADAGFRPSPDVRNDDVKLQVTRDGDGIGGELEVVLSAKVRWALRFSGYAEQQILDLTGGQVSGIEMVAGTRRAELSLSQPAGTVPVKINGAVEELLVKSPAANPVRVRVDGGAKTVVAGSRTLKDVPAGSTLTPKNWATQNRYDVAAGARITSLTVQSV